MYITVLKPFDDIGTRVIIGVVDNWFENELISSKPKTIHMTMRKHSSLFMGKMGS